MKKYFETPTQVMFWQDAEIMQTILWAQLITMK